MEDVSERSLVSLKAECTRLGVDTRFFVEKSEYIEALRAHQYYEEEQNEGDGVHAYCESCGSGDGSPGNEILLCDGARCPAAWHQRCLDPPLVTIPAGSWYCPGCTKVAASEKEKAVEAMGLAAIKGELTLLLGAPPRGLVEKREYVKALVAARQNAAVSNGGSGDDLGGSGAAASPRAASSPGKGLSTPRSMAASALSPSSGGSNASPLDPVIAAMHQMRQLRKEREEAEARKREAEAAAKWSKVTEEELRAEEAQEANDGQKAKEAKDGQKAKEAKDGQKAKEAKDGQKAKEAAGKTGAEKVNDSNSSARRSNGKQPAAELPEGLPPSKRGKDNASTSRASSSDVQPSMPAGTSIPGFPPLYVSVEQSKDKRASEDARSTKANGAAERKTASAARKAQEKEAPQSANSKRASSRGAPPADDAESSRAAASASSLSANPTLEQIQAVVTSIIESAPELKALTSRTVRASAEAKLGLAAGGLDARKKEVKAVIEKAVLAREAAEADAAGQPGAGAGGSGGGKGNGNGYGDDGGGGGQDGDAKARTSSDGQHEGTSSPAPPRHITVTIEGHAIAMKRKHVESIEALASALVKGMPAGSAPSKDMLLSMKMKASYSADAAKRVKVDPSLPEAVRQVADKAWDLYIWRPKA